MLGNLIDRNRTWMTCFLALRSLSFDGTGICAEPPQNQQPPGTASGTEKASAKPSAASERQAASPLPLLSHSDRKALFRLNRGQDGAAPQGGAARSAYQELDALRARVLESPEFEERARVSTWKTLSRFVADVCDVGAGRAVDLGVQGPNQLPAQDGLKVVCDLLQQSRRGALQLAARNPASLERLCAATVEELSRHKDEPTFKIGVLRALASTLQTYERDLQNPPRTQNELYGADKAFTGVLDDSAILTSHLEWVKKLTQAGIPGEVAFDPAFFALSRLCHQELRLRGEVRAAARQEFYDRIRLDASEVCKISPDLVVPFARLILSSNPDELGFVTMDSERLVEFVNRFSEFGVSSTRTAMNDLAKVLASPSRELFDSVISARRMYGVDHIGALSDTYYQLEWNVTPWGMSNSRNRDLVRRLSLFEDSRKRDPNAPTILVVMPRNYGGNIQIGGLADRWKHGCRVVPIEIGSPGELPKFLDKLQVLKVKSLAFVGFEYNSGKVRGSEKGLALSDKSSPEALTISDADFAALSGRLTPDASILTTSQTPDDNERNRGTGTEIADHIAEKLGKGVREVSVVPANYLDGGDYVVDGTMGGSGVSVGRVEGSRKSYATIRYTRLTEKKVTAREVREKDQGAP